MSDRSHTKELIDLGPSHYSPEEYADCLYQLDRIGRYLGGDRATFWAFNQLEPPPTSIVDVGCGGGYFTAKLADRYPDAQVIGADLSAEAIAIARDREIKPNLQFVIPKSARLVDAGYDVDVIVATLVCHHFSDKDLIVFLKDAYTMAKQAVIINDLHRHTLSSAGYRWMAPLFFPNRLVVHDGLISISRGFTRREWVSLLAIAGIPSTCYSITWHCLFRWIVLIKTTPVRVP